ncbi:BrnT family toxin [Phyllobacterium sp. SYP-B3895]|uniref:BrnT family toxin n=1 Tax=Phyllobacterium sp. SYP-B3895 TaxID=2663240 RepID=UPI0012995208|nr:BrnT family toxin [Phyllobacterium sp. SYP-B3895]MRG54850.1 BrnT family toxin [Phyllobacterium sp. SYP-B3895]
MTRFEWDPEKAKRNLSKHGVSFRAGERFEFPSALEFIDDRENYGEERVVSIGFIGEVLHTMTYTERNGWIRIISLRKSTTAEIRRYAKAYE